MKAISLWQPWASALFAPVNPGVSPRSIKENETRSWALPGSCIGIRIAIHAAKRDTKDEREFWIDCVMSTPHRVTYGNAFRAIGIEKYSDLPRGAIIGEVVFASAVHTERMDAVGEIESEWGNFSPGRFAWPVVETFRYDQPVLYMGRQGFFDFTPPQP